MLVTDVSLNSANSSSISLISGNLKKPSRQKFINIVSQVADDHCGLTVPLAAMD